MAKVRGTLTSPDGCTVSVDGTATVGRVDGFWTLLTFTGTITFGGKAGCPSGSITFKHDASGRRPSTDKELVAMVDTADLRSVSKITWRGRDRRAIALLNTRALSATLCEQLRAVAEASEGQPR